jgi:hypothetical protein
MQLANDYLTLLQLAVGLNLVVGAYGSHRKHMENKIGDELSASREQIDEILDSKSPPVLELAPNLEKKEVKKLTDRELSRYLGDVSIRFYQRCHSFGQRDKIVEPWLVPIGLLCLVGLIYASLWPQSQVSNLIVDLFLVIGFVPALWAFMRLVRETAEHERFYRRQANISYREKVADEHGKRIRSEKVDGEIFRVMNQIRVRHREHVKKIRTVNRPDFCPQIGTE